MVKEEVSWEVKYVTMNENENTIYPNLWEDTVKAVFKGKFIAINANIRKDEVSKQ
jgi:hypothetical protein